MLRIVHQVSKVEHSRPTEDDSNDALDLSLFPLLPSLLRLDEVVIFWSEVRVYPGCGLLEFCGGFEDVVRERDGNKADDGQHKEGEELPLGIVIVVG